MENPHSKLRDAELLNLHEKTCGRYYANETGMALAARYIGGKGWVLEKPERPIAFGLRGSTDIIGIFTFKSPKFKKFGGFFFGGEVKTGKAVLSPQQKKFRKEFVLAHGGCWVEIRKEFQAVEAIKKFLAKKIKAYT